MTRLTGMEIEISDAMKIALAVCSFALSIIAKADDAVGLVDPTRPGSYYDAEPQPTGPVLQSTIVAPGIKRAVVSGKTYNVGDRMGNATIVDIRPYEVVLDQGGRETRLRVVPMLTKEFSGTARAPVKGVNP